MELLQHIVQGMSAALTAANLGWVLLGSLVGLLMSVISGLGPLVAMALLVPMMSGLGPLPSLILLVSIYCGSQYAAMNLRVLVPECGSAVPAVMAMDGYQLARQGHGGLALATASIASCAGACAAILLVGLLAPLLAPVATFLGVAEMFSLVVLSLVGAVVLSPGSVSKAIAMVVLGVLLSRVGAGEISGLLQQVVGVPNLLREIPLVVLLIAVFVFSEVIAQLSQPDEARQTASAAIGSFKPSRGQIEFVRPSVARGAALGALMGLLPGRAAVLASVAAHKMEKHLAGPGGLFGRGDLRGVAGPDAACQAGVQASFLPMLTFGIPLNAVMALLVGVMVLKGVQTGPGVIHAQPSFFWGLVTALGVSQVFLVLVNLPLRALWQRLITLPYRHVFPVITILGCVGIYALRGSAHDVYLASGLAVMGYAFHKLRCPVGPLLLGFILGPMMESHLREALQTYGGWSVLVTRPVSAAFLSVAVCLVVLMMLPAIQRPRASVFKESSE